MRMDDDPEIRALRKTDSLVSHSFRNTFIINCTRVPKEVLLKKNKNYMAFKTRRVSHRSQYSVYAHNAL